MVAKEQARKTLVGFYRTPAGSEPVREWLKALPQQDRHTVGKDLMRVQFRWPVGMPLCRSMGEGLWEVRTRLPSERIARVLFCFNDGELWLLHGFIKKSQKTPIADLALARQHMKEIKR
jgi:phage-related protein